MLYEFRTLKDRRHPSLIMLAGCDNDIEAILIAQEFLRKGEGLEVWRGEQLIYRLAARIRPGKGASRCATVAPKLAEPTPSRLWRDAAKKWVRDIRRNILASAGRGS
jgi:hypothetical protein